MSSSRLPASRRRTSSHCRRLASLSSSAIQSFDPGSDAPHGLVGVYPADEEYAPDQALPLPEQGIAISPAMECAIWSCDATTVNLSPFR